MPRRISSRELNQNVTAAKRAAAEGPVVITDRGRPAFVLMSFDHYLRLAGERPSIVELLALPEEVEFEPARLSPGELRVPDLG